MKRESERIDRRKERWERRTKRNPYHLENTNKEVTQIILSDEIEFDVPFDESMNRIDFNGRRIYFSGDGNPIFDFSHISGGRSESGRRRGRNSLRASSRRKRRK